MIKLILSFILSAMIIAFFISLIKDASLGKIPWLVILLLSPGALVGIIVWIKTSYAIATYRPNREEETIKKIANKIVAIFHKHEGDIFLAIIWVNIILSAINLVYALKHN